LLLVLSPFGGIDSVRLHRDEAGTSRGFAFVKFTLEHDALIAHSKIGTRGEDGQEQKKGGVGRLDAYIERDHFVFSFLHGTRLFSGPKDTSSLFYFFTRGGLLFRSVVGAEQEGLELMGRQIKIGFVNDSSITPGSSGANATGELAEQHGLPPALKHATGESYPLLPERISSARRPAMGRWRPSAVDSFRFRLSGFLSIRTSMWKRVCVCARVCVGLVGRITSRPRACMHRLMSVGNWKLDDDEGRTGLSLDATSRLALMQRLGGGSAVTGLPVPQLLHPAAPGLMMPGMMPGMLQVSWTLSHTPNPLTLVTLSEVLLPLGL
jgi:hypothetical protein